MSWGTTVAGVEIAGRKVRVGDTISNGRERYQVSMIITAHGRPTALILAGPDAPLVYEETFKAGWAVVERLAST